MTSKPNAKFGDLMAAVFFIAMVLGTSCGNDEASTSNSDSGSEASQGEKGSQSLPRPYPSSSESELWDFLKQLPKEQQIEFVADLAEQLSSGKATQAQEAIFKKWMAFGAGEPSD